MTNRPSTTVHGYEMSEMASVQQKAIRAGPDGLFDAGFAAVERDESGNGKAAFGTNFTCASEDINVANPCAIIVVLIYYSRWNRALKEGNCQGRTSKSHTLRAAREQLVSATVALARSKKSRLAPHASVVSICGSLKLLKAMDLSQFECDEELMEAIEWRHSIGAPPPARDGSVPRMALDGERIVHMFAVFLKNTIDLWTEVSELRKGAADDATPADADGDQDLATKEARVIQMEEVLLTLAQMIYAIDSIEKRRVSVSAAKFVSSIVAAQNPKWHPFWPKLKGKMEKFYARPVTWCFAALFSLAQKAGNQLLMYSLLCLLECMAGDLGSDRLNFLNAILFTVRHSVITWEQPALGASVLKEPEVQKIMELYEECAPDTPDAKDAAKLAARRKLVVQGRYLDKHTFRGKGRKTTDLLGKWAESEGIDIGLWDKEEIAKSHGPGITMYRKASQGTPTYMSHFLDEGAVLCAEQCDVIDDYAEQAREIYLREEENFGHEKARSAYICERRYPSWLKALGAEVTAEEEACSDANPNVLEAAGEDDAEGNAVEEEEEEPEDLEPRVAIAKKKATPPPRKRKAPPVATTAASKGKAKAPAHKGGEGSAGRPAAKRARKSGDGGAPASAVVDFAEFCRMVGPGQEVVLQQLVYAVYDEGESSPAFTTHVSAAAPRTPERGAPSSGGTKRKRPPPVPRRPSHHVTDDAEQPDEPEAAPAPEEEEDDEHEGGEDRDRAEDEDDEDVEAAAAEKISRNTARLQKAAAASGRSKKAPPARTTGVKTGKNPAPQKKATAPKAKTEPQAKRRAPAAKRPPSSKLSQISLLDCVDHEALDPSTVKLIEAAPLCQLPTGNAKKFVRLVVDGDDIAVYKGPYNLALEKDVNTVQRILYRQWRMKECWGDEILLEQRPVSDGKGHVYMRSEFIGTCADPDAWDTETKTMNTHDKSDVVVVARESAGVVQLRAATSKLWFDDVAGAAFVDLAARYVMGCGDAHLGNIIAATDGSRVAAVDIEDNREKIRLHTDVSPPSLLECLVVNTKTPGMKDKAKFMKAVESSLPLLCDFCERVQSEDTARAIERAEKLKFKDAPTQEDILARVKTLEKCIAAFGVNASADGADDGSSGDGGLISNLFADAEGVASARGAVGTSGRKTKAPSTTTTAVGAKTKAEPQKDGLTEVLDALV